MPCLGGQFDGLNQLNIMFEMVQRRQEHMKCIFARLDAQRRARCAALVSRISTVAGLRMLGASLAGCGLGDSSRPKRTSSSGLGSAVISLGWTRSFCQAIERQAKADGKVARQQIQPRSTKHPLTAGPDVSQRVPAERQDEAGGFAVFDRDSIGQILSLRWIAEFNRRRLKAEVSLGPQPRAAGRCKHRQPSPDQRLKWLPAI